DDDRAPPARLQRREHPGQLGGRGDRLTVDGDDHVSDVHPGFRSRSTRRYRADVGTASLRGANLDAEICAVRVDYPAVDDDLAGDLRNETPSIASACQRFGSGAPIRSRGELERAAFAVTRNGRHRSPA